MSKIKVCVYNLDEYYKEFDIFTSIKIGQFIKLIIDTFEDQESFDLFNTKLMYDEIQLDHSKTFEYYTDFQYKKTDIYKLTIIPKIILKRKTSVTFNNLQSTISNNASHVSHVTHANHANHASHVSQSISNYDISRSLPTDLNIYKPINKNQTIHDNKIEERFQIIDIKLQSIDNKLESIDNKLNTILELFKIRRLINNE